MKGAALLVLVLFVAALGGAAARADEGDPVDVRVEAARGAILDWTALTIEVTSSGWGRGVGGTRGAVEKEARDAIEPAMEAGARRLQVTSVTSLADLYEDPKLGGALEGRAERWVVAEGRYFASGRVELVGALSLIELVKPWTLSRARLAPTDAREPAFTGLVVDARGTRAHAAYAPRILRDDEVFFDGVLWEDVALFTAPVLYVSDPAHPAASRAGPKPMFVRAEAALGADLVLTEEDAQRFRTGMKGARVLGEGTVVIVIDP